MSKRAKKDDVFPPAAVHPGIHAQPPATKADLKTIPQDWEPIWDEDFEETFAALVPKQRLFVVEMVRTGFKKAEAFRRAYPGAEYSSGIVDAILSKPGVKAILERFTDWAMQDLFEARQVIKDAMEAKKKVYFEGAEVDEVDDHAIRLKAVEVLNKMNGANKEEDEKPKGKVINIGYAVTFNYYLEQMGMPPIPIPVAIQESTKK